MNTIMRRRRKRSVSTTRASTYVSATLLILIADVHFALGHLQRVDMSNVDDVSEVVSASIFSEYGG
jgi:hypothetical protein